jgi:hypothetical protein
LFRRRRRERDGDRTASLGSLLRIEAFLADAMLSISSMRTQTREEVSSAISEI